MNVSCLTLSNAAVSRPISTMSAESNLEPAPLENDPSPPEDEVRLGLEGKLLVGGTLGVAALSAFVPPAGFFLGMVGSLAAGLIVGERAASKLNGVGGAALGIATALGGALLSAHMGVAANAGSLPATLGLAALNMTVTGLAMHDLLTRE